MTEQPEQNTPSGEGVDGRQGRRAWTRRQLDRIASLTDDQPVHRYGTAEWARLADGDPRKWAAVLATAEGVARDEDQLPERLEAELEAGRQEDERAAAEAFAQAQRISHDLQRRPDYEKKRQREREAAEPQPGDYLGGPVSWEPDPTQADVPKPRVEAAGENTARKEDPVERARRAVAARERQQNTEPGQRDQRCGRTADGPQPVQEATPEGMELSW